MEAIAVSKVLPDVERSVIPACDVRTLDAFHEIVATTHDVPGIGGYKVGFALTGRFSLTACTRIVAEYTTLPVIYDHQKAGTDIPEVGVEFAAMVADGGAAAAIIFPQAGPVTEEDFIGALQDAGVEVLMGLEMTHPKYLSSAGGWIDDNQFERAYQIATDLGVRDFVVPGNKPERVAYYHNLISKLCGSDPFALWAPGFVAQGGKISEAGEVAGERWHAIVGRGITQVEDKKAAAMELVSQIIHRCSCGDDSHTIDQCPQLGG